jgi:hypothetical protein
MIMRRLPPPCAAGLPVLPLYVVEPDYWQQPFASRRHWHFVHDSLTNCGKIAPILVSLWLCVPGQSPIYVTIFAKSL